MSILSTERLGHSFNDRWLFRNLHFGVQKGDRIALVGINGAGKSTLLKILAGQQEPTEGIVATERGSSIGFLSQDPDFKGLKTVHDFVYNPENEQQNIIYQYERLLNEPYADQKKLDELTDKISSLNAWEYEHQIKTILSRLGISDLSQEIQSLSGGQRKRLALARLLIEDPDIYILDEPTNHLDIETIEWLEKLLMSGNKTVLLVSHDRYFLDAVCTEIRELDRGNLYTYAGNYAYYLEKKAEREHGDQLLIEKSRNLLKKELEWMRRQPQARGTKSKARIEAFYDLEEKAKTQIQNGKVQLSIKTSRQGNKILEINTVSKQFDGRTIIRDFDYIFKRGDRIGLAGKNGSGKSTFLNLLYGSLSPDNGSVVPGETTVIGYYRQSGLDFNDSDRVIDVVKEVADYIEMAGGETLSASQLLSHFLFPPSKQHGLIKNLSGGEKKRLHLMRVLMKNPNVLILDEPTNDLDIDTLNVLEDFLEHYSGVLILVSHDRYLIDKLSEQLFVFDGLGNIQIYNGNYADYKAEEEELARQKKTAAHTAVPKEKTLPADPGKRKPSFKERQEFESLSEHISALEAEIRTTTLRLGETSDHQELTLLAESIQGLTRDLDKKTERWMELSEII